MIIHSPASERYYAILGISPRKQFVNTGLLRGQHYEKIRIGTRICLFILLRIDVFDDDALRGVSFCNREGRVSLRLEGYRRHLPGSTG